MRGFYKERPLTFHSILRASYVTNIYAGSIFSHFSVINNVQACDFYKIVSTNFVIFLIFLFFVFCLFCDSTIRIRKV